MANPENTRQPIPLFSLKKQNDLILDSVNKSWTSLIKNQEFILGPNVRDFESQFANINNVKHCKALNSGTDALMLALASIKIVPGDEIITTPLTFPATIEPALHLGAKVVLADIDPSSGLIDVPRVLNLITKKTRVIIPVHLYGNVVDCTSLSHIDDIYLIEDACQAFGSRINQVAAGTHGDIGCFSFYPTKNLSAWGDAGALITNNDEIASTVDCLRNHGQMGRNNYEYVGYNSRMDEMQAAVLKEKIKCFDSLIEEKMILKKLYYKGLSQIPQVHLIHESESVSSVLSLMTILVENRDGLKNFLQDHAIQSGVYYPMPIHQITCYSNLVMRPQPLVHSEKWCQSCLSLPFFNGLSSGDVEYIIDIIGKFYC